LAQLRQDIGFVFQQFHLLPELTALHNVALPLKLRGEKNAEATASAWLEKVGLGHRFHHKPQQLSGGEQQRAAIARALVFEPKFIFADEPTGNLDSKSAAAVADILFACCQQNGAALVMVTHNPQLAARAQQVFTFNNGNFALLEKAQMEVQGASY
jgi:putative ABC transport system ATP-binding protein